MTAPRGIRNNNPLNIEYNERNKWQGRVARHQSTDPRFEQFIHAKWGIRAGAVLIINHYDRRRACTIRKLITIWAPKHENDTEAYIETVAKLSGFDPDEELCFHQWEHLAPVIKAMIYVENGVQPYSDALIDEGLRLAGVERPAPMPIREVANTDTGKGSIATGGVIATTIVTAGPLLKELDWRVAIVIVLVLTVTTVLGVMIWRSRRS